MRDAPLQAIKGTDGDAPLADIHLRSARTLGTARPGRVSFGTTPWPRGPPGVGMREDGEQMSDVATVERGALIRV